MYRQEEFCDSCNQKNQCQDIYRKLGQAEGPSVVLKSLAAFVLPILVFIATLAAFEKVSGRIPGAGKLQTPLGLLFALAASFGCILTTKAISRLQSRHK